MSPRTCRRCSKRPPKPGEKFCPTCRDTVLAQIERTGYFTPRVVYDRPRPPEAREAERETRGILE